MRLKRSTMKLLESLTIDQYFQSRHDFRVFNFKIILYCNNIIQIYARSKAKKITTNAYKIINSYIVYQKVKSHESRLYKNNSRRISSKSRKWGN